MQGKLNGTVRRSSHENSRRAPLRRQVVHAFNARRASSSAAPASVDLSDLRDISTARLGQARSHDTPDIAGTPNVSDNLRNSEWDSCNSDSFEKMYVELRRRFQAVAYSILGNTEDAQDAVQDALVSGYSNLRKFEGRSGLATWFTRIVMNASLMLLRKRKSTRLRFADESPKPGEPSWTERVRETRPDPEMLYAEVQTSQVVDELLSGASPLLSEAFRMRHYDEFSNEEGARKLGITTNTFKSRVFRARQYLAKKTKYSLVAPLRRPERALAISANSSIGSVAGEPK